MGTRELPNSSAAPSLARAFVADTLCTNDLERLSETVVLLTSEAVTNAVRHAHSPSVVTIDKVAGGVRVTVSDHGSGTVKLKYPEPTTPSGGRGLLIIDRMSTRWGVERSAEGNDVWFEVELDD